eukprot:9441832-Pyramimonas_sp.AAC.1
MHLGKSEIQLECPNPRGTQMIIARRVIGVGHPTKLAEFTSSAGWSWHAAAWGGWGCTLDETTVMNHITSA